MPPKEATLKVKLDLSEARQQIEQLRQELRGLGIGGGSFGAGAGGSMAPRAGDMGGMFAGLAIGGMAAHGGIGSLTGAINTGFGVVSDGIGGIVTEGAARHTQLLGNLQQGINLTQSNILNSTAALSRAFSSGQAQVGAPGQMELFPGHQAQPMAPSFSDEDLAFTDASDEEIASWPVVEVGPPGSGPSGGGTPPGVSKRFPGQGGFSMNYGALAAEGAWSTLKSGYAGMSGFDNAGWKGVTAGGMAGLADLTNNYTSRIGVQTNRQVANIETGRTPKPWDTATEDYRSSLMWVDVLGTGASAALGGIAGFFGGAGIGALPGAAAGGAAFHTFFQSMTGAAGDQVKRVSEANYERGRSAYRYATTVGSAQTHPNWSTQDWDAASSLSIPLMGGLGKAGGAATNQLLDEFKTNNPSDPEGAAELAKRTAAGLSPEMAGRASVRGWDRDLALSIGLDNQDAMVAYNAGKARSGDTAELLGITGNISRLRDTAAGSVYGAQGAESRTNALIARGGDATQAGVSRQGEIAALNAAKTANDAYIASLDQVKTKTAAQTAELERAKAAGEGFTAAIASKGLATVQGMATERLDIAGTITSGAQSRLGSRIGTARAGDYSVYGDVLSGLSGDRSAIQQSLDEATTPSDKRMYQRQLDSKDAEIWGTRRQSADYTLGQPGRIIRDRLTEAGAGEDIAEAVGSADSIRYTRGRVALQSSRYFRSEQSKLTGMMTRPDLYGDEDISSQSAAVATARAASVNAAVQATRAPMSAMDIAGLGVQDLAVQRALRQGGASAIGATTGLISSWSGIQSTRQSAYNRNPNGATLTDLTTANRNLLSLQESLGSGGLDAGIGTSLDAAISRQRILETNQFAGPGVSRRGAAMETYNLTKSALGDANTRLKAATDPQTRREISGEINRYQESMSSQELNINDGWWNRMVNREIGASSHSALNNVSYRDVLMFDPRGNRHIGSASRDGYATDSLDAGTGRTNKPGSVSNQSTQVLEINLRLDGNKIGTQRMEIGRGMKATLNAKAAG